MADIAARRQAFRQLHESGCFVIPNPWDVGSAKYLASLGFKAMATTSAGFAFSRGLPDEGLSLDVVLEHVREIVEATDLPVNADFQAGYGSTPDEVATSVRRCVATGVSGLSIEDSTGDGNRPLYGLSEALERLHAAKEAIGESGVLLVGRAECFLVGHPDPLNEAAKRIKAYADAGADVLYAPGIRDREQIKAIVDAAGGKPVNMLMHVNLGLTVQDVAALGVRRISVGSSLARTAWTGFVRAATEIAGNGSFTAFDGLTGFAELNRLFETSA